MQSDFMSGLNPTQHQNTTTMTITTDIVCLLKDQFTQIQKVTMMVVVFFVLVLRYRRLRDVNRTDISKPELKPQL